MAKNKELENVTEEMKETAAEEVLENKMEDDATEETAEREQEASRTTLMIDRNTADPAITDASRWHFYETAARSNDEMRRPVFYGVLIGSRRLRVGERNIWAAEVQHRSQQNGIQGMILIPYNELIAESDGISNNGAETRINAMIGAVVEFIITGVVRETDMIVGSRTKAMEILRNRYYIPADRSRRAQIHAGRLVQSRIMAVTPYTLLLDIFGAECRINRQEVKWEWTASLTEDYTVGDILTVKIESVEIEGTTVKVSATGKTGDNPDIANLRYTPVNSMQLGEVTSYANGVYFIRLYAGVNAVAHIITGDKGCGVGDKVKLRVTSFNRNAGTVTGKIVAVF